MTDTFSFEEAKGGKKLVFADRSRRRSPLDLGESSTKPGEGVRGKLPEDESILAAIKAAAEEFDVPLEYGLALAQQESGYDPNAHNAETGADGAFQFIPATAAGHGLVHGRDTRDVAKAARAAMKDFSEQMKKGGPDWAIKHHFAGPNTKLHGSKTRQYLADVQRRAKDIREMLGKEGGTAPVAVEPQEETFSFEEAQGGNIAARPEPKPVAAGMVDSTVDFLARSGGYAANALEKGWEHVRNRMLTDMGQISPDDPNYAPRRGVEDPFADTRDLQRRKDQQAESAGQVPQKGFLANLENPVKLLTEDSLPANALEWLTQAGERERVNFLNARKIQQQESIVANPEKYPAVAVKAAREAIAAREAKQDPSVREIWNDVKQAAVEDPGRFGAQFVNALMADPEMLLAPQGIGLKVVEGTRRVAAGATAASRVTQIADKVIDAGSTGAALNLGIELASAGSRGDVITPAEAAFAGGIGFAASGGLAGLFSRGAAARKSLREGEVSSDTIEQIMRDIAQEELATETILSSPNPTSAVVKHRIEEAAGVKFESDADLKAYLKNTRKEWKALFENRDLNGQYQKYLAEERMARRAQLAEDAQAREVATAAEEAQRSIAQAELAEFQAARTARFQQEFEQALEARKNAEAASTEVAAQAEDQLRTAAAKLDEEELFEAALEGDVPAVKRAMNSALRRDSHMRTPKWQRGDVDPKLLARMGIGSLFAGTAYTLADDNKEAAAFAGGLAGLMLPGGGSVLRRMAQSGATTADGDIVSLLVSQGKLKPVREAGDQMAREADQIHRAKQGNQQAFAELYKENFPRISRYIKKQLGGVAGRLALTPDDVAQEVFIDAFQQLDKFSGDVPFSAYLTRIAKNKAVDAIRQAQTAKGGKDTVTTSMYSAGNDFGDDAAAGHIAEGANPLVKAEVEAAASELDTPELQAMRQEVETQLMNIINKLPERQRQAIILAKVEQYSTAEVAEIMKETAENARQLISRAERAVMEGLEKGYGAKRLVAKEVPEARTEVVPAKRGRGRPRKVIGGIDTELLIKGGVAASVATAAATAGAQMFPKNPKKGALAGVMLVGLGVLIPRFVAGSASRRGAPSVISQQGAFKGLGGNFADSTKSAMGHALAKRGTAGNSFTEQTSRMIERYLNKFAGTADDPLKDIRLPDGNRWGDLMDIAAIRYTDAYGKDAYSLGAGPKHIKTAPIAEKQRAFRDIKNYLEHVHDYLLTVPRQKLNNYDLPRAVKETVAWDEANAKKMANARTKSMEGMPVYKEYPDGYKWVQLKRPGEFAQESDVMGHSVRGYEPHDNQPAYSEIWGDGDATPRHPDWVPEAVGGHKDYGYGGWEAIKSGNVKIYSLRGPNGDSHVTIETKASPDGTNKGIMQIKGKQNDAPGAAYIPYVQDFVKSDKWSLIDDLDNARMRTVEGIPEPVQQQLKKKFGDHGFYTAEEIIKADLAAFGPVVPRGQRGSVDPRLLKVGAVSAMGATAGAFLNEENALLGAGIGALAGGLLLGKGRRGTSIGRQIVDNVDYTLGVVSTRIMNKSPALWRKAIEHERIVLRDTHKYLKAVDPFLVRLQKLPKETNAVLSRSVLTGNPEVTSRLLHAIGDQELIKGWKDVRSTLDSIGDQLVDLKRFGRKELDYFPRIVKDVEGLLKAIGKERGSFLEEAIKTADQKAIRSRGTGLTEIEKSLVINKVLANERHQSQQPGFAKNRGIEEITPELQQFYASPTESLHSYIRSAVEDIQRAKFFGKDLEVVKKGGKEFTNVDISIGNTVQRLINEGKLTGKDAEEVGALLKSRFINGERAPAELIQASKNLSYAGLLGNPVSAMTQLGDAIIQMYVQDVRATLAAVARSATGRKIVDMKDFGLVDHIAEEFVSTSRSAKALNKIFKYGLFKFVDQYGKNIALNAAVTRFSRLAKSDGGIQQIASRYADALAPDEFDQLIKDLRKGEPTDLVRSIAFAELSRTQPITRIELPQAYLDNPNGRLLYQYKTFMIKQIDLARRDALNEMKKGNVARGMRNLAGIGITLGLAGMTTGVIKDFMRGRELELTLSDIPVNALKTFGLSEYVLDHMFGVSKEEAKERREDGEVDVRATKAEPLQTVVKMFAPPAQMFDHIVTGDPRALRYIPIIGPFVYEQYLADKEEES